MTNTFSFMKIEANFKHNGLYENFIAYG